MSLVSLVEELKVEGKVERSKEIAIEMLKDGMGIPQIVKFTKAVGSLRLPSTSNAVERFFDRLYRLKGPFCDEASAQKHLRLFMLGYFLTIGQLGPVGPGVPVRKGRCGLGQIPLYHLLNRPNVIALKDRMAEQYRQQAA
jgi:hypothetical protein